VSFQNIITELDAQIETLQAARNLLASRGSIAPNSRASLTLVKTKKPHHTISAEARRRIGEATRKRWAQGRMPHALKKKKAA
jgi:cytosine/adenosine deaminase-related metal-dependent hydrolase